MSDTAAASSPASPSVRRRWELPLLGLLAVLTFAMIPISINTVPGGLPAHPLIIHVPVIFIPLAAFGGLVLAIVPRWYSGHAGPWIGLAAVIALGSLDLAMSAGSDLRSDLGLTNPTGGVAHIVNQHANAAGQLRVLFIAFTALYLIAFAVFATADGSTSGVAIGDRIFAGIRSVPFGEIGLRVLTGVLALVCLYWVYRVGDLGAKAVWYAKLHGGGLGGGPPAHG